MTVPRLTRQWTPGPLPFIWTSLERPTNEPLPDSLPFTLCLDEDAGRFRQAADPSVTGALAAAYASSSIMSGMMDEKGLGLDYAEDFLRFIGEAAGSRLEGRRVLEIGCGTGYLLHRLARLGATVVGVEPGPHGQTGAARYHVDVVKDYFPSRALNGTFDLLIAYAFIEHVEDPVALLSGLHRHANPETRLLIAVPDCTGSIEGGDLSMLLHEHWSYFTSSTLDATLRLGGWEATRIVRAGFGGVLYAAAFPIAGGRFGGACQAPASGGVETFDAFVERAGRLIRRVRDYLGSAVAERHSVGVYVPGRLANCLCLDGMPRPELRFFDDNPLLQGTYLPGLDVPIEPRTGLVQRPTRRVLIASTTFGTKVAGELMPLLPTTCDVTLIEDLLH